MARFNLGCIKGSKGDPGPKGETGPKGDTGERGLRGTDGITPVFSINKVETLDSSWDANVEIDASVPSQPKLNFYIPRGADGKDAVGDMQSAIYDTSGIKRDIYAYANELFESCVKKDGATMAGKLVAYGGESAEHCGRNISFVSKLPDSAINGELCFVITDSAGKKLSDCDIGSIILLEEGGSKEQYLVAAKNYYRNSGVTLVRRYLTKNLYYYYRESRDEYWGSDIDFYLESIFIGSYSSYIRNNILSSPISSTRTRRCFLPSKTELGEIEYFVNNGKKGTIKNQTTGTEYMTRDLSSSNYIVSVNPEGEFSTVKPSQKARIRPMITLPGDMYVENTVSDGEAVSQPNEKRHTLYVYKDGEWKELSL